MAGVTASHAIRRFIASAIFLRQRTRIVSYPNSGRTWLRVMLADLDAYPRFTHAQSKFALALPAAEIGARMQRYTHRRVLFLIRDPKDTVCSNYYHVTKADKRWQGDFKTFLRHPNFGFERILAFNLAWTGAHSSFHRGFHIESYEDMCANTADALARIVDFLDMPPVARETLTAVAEKNQFDRMKRREETGELFSLHGDRFTREKIDDVNERKVRRGRIGGHVDDMDEADIAYCDNLLRQYRYDERMTAALERSPELA
jgi:hypothetical protein